MTTAANNGYAFECAKYEALIKLLPNIIQIDKEKYLRKKQGLKPLPDKLTELISIFSMQAAADFLNQFLIKYGATPDKIRFGDDPASGDVSDITLYKGHNILGASEKWHSTEIKTLRLSSNKLAELGFLITPKLEKIITFLQDFTKWSEAKAAYGKGDALLADLNLEFASQFQALQNPSNFIDFIFGDCDYLIYRVTQNRPNVLNRKIITPDLKPTIILAVQPSAKTRDTISIIFDKQWQVTARLKNKDSDINHSNIFGSLDYKIDLINSPVFGDVL